jgi:AAA+ ATPase superfamily predicted ATPase
MIGRKAEIAELQRIMESRKAEFAVVYGRRRVGKTYLVREFFANKFAFYHTGMANSTTKEQLRAFNSSLNEYGTIKYPQAGTWFDSFQQLAHLLSISRKRGKRVVCPFLI